MIMITRIKNPKKYYWHFFSHVLLYKYNNSNRYQFKRKEDETLKYVCDVCGWEYDEEKGYPEGGIAPGTKWEDVPEDFECPLCFVGKDQFSKE